MIIEKVLHNDQQDVALIYRGVQWTYGAVKSLLISRAHVLASVDKVPVINHQNPIKFVIDFLAAAYIEKAVVIGSSKILKRDDHFELEDWEFEDFLSSESYIKRSITNSFKFGILSSGSNGVPKVIWRTNDEWESAFTHQSDVFNIKSNNKLFVLGALAYSANLNCTLHTLWNGGEVSFGELQFAKSWPELIIENNIDSIFLVPSHWKFLVDSFNSFSTIKSCVSAGEKLNSDLCGQIISSFPNAVVTEYYGAAELGHISYHQDQEIIENPLSVGKPFPLVSLDIKNQKIHVRSPYVAKKYKKTGTVNDLGYLEKGSLILLGRAGRMFNKRGLNIYAQEIETTAQTHPNIEKAILIKSSQDRLCLLYSLQRSVVPTSKEEVWQILEEYLPKAKHPHFIKKVDYLPLTESGKIDYQELKRSYESNELNASI